MPLPPSHSADVDNFYYTNKIISSPRVIIGDYTYGMPTMKMAQGIGKIQIGKFCSISNTANLTILPEHETNCFSTYPFAHLKTDWPKKNGDVSAHYPAFRGDINVGNDVWVGENATILGGATIGDGAIIGACAVVAGTVHPYTIVIGNPAKIIKYRFEDDTILKLLEIKWWDWPLEKIQENVHLLCSGDIDALYAAI